MMSLKVKNLKKLYNKKTGVEDININVESKSIHALLGVNGSGKSTTIKCIVGIIFPDSGEIEIYSEKLTENNYKLKSKIGYSPELPAFPKHMTGEDCIESYAYIKGLNKIDVKIESKKLLDDFNLYDARNNKVSGYSRGMLAKLDIAISMIGNPEILILDEPTAGLDPVSSENVKAMLKKYASDGNTVVLSSHQLSDVEKLCSYATIINKGKTIMESSMEKLLQNSGERIYIAEFSKLNPEFISSLNEINGIKKVDKHNDTSLIIHADHDIRPDISLEAQNHGILLYSCNEDINSLEDVFLGLINNKTL